MRWRRVRTHATPSRALDRTVAQRFGTLAARKTAERATASRAQMQNTSAYATRAANARRTRARCALARARGHNAHSNAPSRNVLKTLHNGMLAYTLWRNTS
eukprot:11178390-Lingulodinium_polyedra.AAC.1